MFVVVPHPASNNQLELIGWLLAAGAMSSWANRSASCGLRVRAADKGTAVLYGEESKVGGCCHHAMSWCMEISL